MIPAPASQIPGIYRRKIGDIVVTAISDGFVDLPYDMMKDVTAADAEAILQGAFRPAPPRLSVNCFVIHSAGRVALVDSGFGGTLDDKVGHLPERLRLAGVDIGAIDSVILTHMHPDHSNGLTNSAGEAIFPNAELIVSETDVKHWHDDAAAAKASERHRERFFLGGRKQVKPYMNRRRDAKGEVFPGVTAIPLPGHTPGHTGYRISSGDKTLFLWGDIVHIPDVQVQRPEVFVDPDSDGAAAIATRRRVFDMVAADRLLVAGSHMHFPGFLHLTGDATRGYQLQPETWVQAFDR
jgi:glyoxylase-like metal-dependent hydrolase (beta-lactamase superfamily II)